jgi:hypothetical protein
MEENTQWRGSEAPPRRKLCWSGMDPLELPLLAVLKEAGLTLFWGGTQPVKMAHPDSCFQSPSDHVQLFAIGDFPLKYHHITVRVAVLPRHQEHLDNGQRSGRAGKAASTGKGGRPRIGPSDSTFQGQGRRNRRTWHLIQTSVLGTKFSFACSRLMNVLKFNPRAKTHLKTQSNGENIGSPQPAAQSPWAAFGESN